MGSCEHLIGILVSQKKHLSKQEREKPALVCSHTFKLQDLTPKSQDEGRKHKLNTTRTKIHLGSTFTDHGHICSLRSKHSQTGSQVFHFPTPAGHNNLPGTSSGRRGIPLSRFQHAEVAQLPVFGRPLILSSKNAACTSTQTLL